MLVFKLLCALSSVALSVSARVVHTDDCCDTSKAVMDLPAGQTALVSPTSAALFVMLGVGIQNYTCTSATSTYASIGAVASLFDISCLDKKPQFSSIQSTAFKIWDSPASLKASASSIGARVGAPKLLGFHYFVTAPSGTGISPKWDFTSTGKFAGDASAYVLGAKVGDIPAPTSPATNVDWLALNNAQGSLASKIFRIDTVGGQPPTSCIPGSAPIEVKYTAKYYLY
ncbi:hypothetical protein B0H15DRAFT_152994 [Mycena belliarum]|uniref:Malate dehydrogenase n=1 Tax=Mycena belliarum TaxID=1033014 RepID=A0AAD6XHS3_9AGAR|nr:hypothetical protein B0H15DRAFT_152994 [Mycena belliae]